MKWTNLAACTLGILLLLVSPTFSQQRTETTATHTYTLQPAATYDAALAQCATQGGSLSTYEDTNPDEQVIIDDMCYYISNGCWIFRPLPSGQCTHVIQYQPIPDTDCAVSRQYVCKVANAQSPPPPSPSPSPPPPSPSPSPPPPPTSPPSPASPRPPRAPSPPPTPPPSPPTPPSPPSSSPPPPTNTQNTSPLPLSAPPPRPPLNVASIKPTDGAIIGVMVPVGVIVLGGAVYLLYRLNRRADSGSWDVEMASRQPKQPKPPKSSNGSPSSAAAAAVSVFLGRFKVKKQGSPQGKKELNPLYLEGASDSFAKKKAPAGRRPLANQAADSDASGSGSEADSDERIPAKAGPAGKAAGPAAAGRGRGGPMNSAAAGAAAARRPGAAPQRAPPDSDASGSDDSEAEEPPARPAGRGGPLAGRGRGAPAAAAGRGRGAPGAARPGSSRPPASPSGSEDGSEDESGSGSDEEPARPPARGAVGRQTSAAARQPVKPGGRK